MQDPPARILPSKVNQHNFVDRLLAELYSERRAVKDLWCALGITRARFEALISECRDELARNGVQLHTATVSQASMKSRYITADGRRVAALSAAWASPTVAGDDDDQVVADLLACDAGAMAVPQVVEEVPVAVPQVAAVASCATCGTFDFYLDGRPACPLCYHDGGQLRHHCAACGAVVAPGAEICRECQIAFSTVLWRAAVAAPGPGDAPVTAPLVCPSCGAAHQVANLITGDTLWCSCGAFIPVRHTPRTRLPGLLYERVGVA